MKKGLLIAVLLFAGIAVCRALPAKESVPNDRPPVTVLLMNDVYRLDNLPGVRALRRNLESQYGQVLVLHAGDFLFPSLLSRRYDGAQMIDVMNRLDGDEKADDPLMFVTFGNHEFDKDRLEHHGLLTERIRESGFDWISSNVHFKPDQRGTPLVHGENLHPYRLVDVSGTRVGIFGITIDYKVPAYAEPFGDYFETARAMTAKLREEGAELVIALTHLSMDKDKELLGRLGDAGPDIVFGGHEHNRQTAQIRGRLVIKADADALSVAVAQIWPRKGEPPIVDHRFQIIPGELSFDPSLAERAAYWESRYQNEYCGEHKLGAHCLEEVIGRTQVELVAEELTIRRFATNLGDWIMDLALEAFREQGAQIAFVNSGSLRLNHNIPAGSEITRKTLYELFAYRNELVLIRIRGAQLKRVLRHSIRDWTGSGHWLQIGGFRFRHHPERGIVDDVRLVVPGGSRPVDDEEQILAVTNLYLIDDKGDQDGYRMLDPRMMAHPDAESPLLRDIVVVALKAAEPEGIAPVEDGRICNALFAKETCGRP